MKDFQKEKEKLQIELQQLIKQFPAHQWLIALEQALEKMTTPADLDGSFKKVKKTIKKLATFEKRHMDKKNRIQSKELRKLAKKLKKKGHRVTFVGKAWSKQTANWIYFDTVLDIEALQSKYSLGDHIEVHQNLDPRSGKERGFIDTQTGEGLMWRLG